MDRSGAGRSIRANVSWPVVLPGDGSVGIVAVIDEAGERGGGIDVGWRRSKLVKGIMPVC